MGFAALFSGGKDSTYALHLALRDGITVDCLVTMVPENTESYMFHVPNSTLTPLHSEAMGITHYMGYCSGVEEGETGELEDVLATADVDGVITGAIASSYQMSRIEELCTRLGLEVFAPLWHRDEEDILHDIVDAGFSVIFVSVSAEGLDDSWLGRPLDGMAIRDLSRIRGRYRINMSGEGGEYETLVLDGPGFARKIAIEESEAVWRGNSGVLLIKKASLMEKPGAP